jgi:hypothetical protein
MNPTNWYASSGRHDVDIAHAHSIPLIAAELASAVGPEGRYHVTSCRMRASRRGLASTYTAVVLMLLCPAISAIAFRSIPRSARRVIQRAPAAVR